MKWQVDEIASWWNGKLMKWQVDEMASWQNDWAPRHITVKTALKPQSPVYPILSKSRKNSFKIIKRKKLLFNDKHKFLNCFIHCALGYKF